MINPPLELIRNATVKDFKGNSEIPALLVTIKPGTYSRLLNLSISYNITSYSRRTLDVNIIFENPLPVSSMADPE